MKKYSQKIFWLKIICLTFILGLAGSLAGQAIAAAPTSGILKGVECAGGNDAVMSVPGQSQAYTLAKPCTLCDGIKIFVNIADLIVGVSGTLAVLIFIYAGLMYLTASVRPDNINRAKSAITAAIIGLVFIFGGYMIVNFLIITFVGGEEGMSYLYSITGQSSWGVCAEPGISGQSH